MTYGLSNGQVTDDVMRAGAQIIFLESGRGLGHATPTTAVRSAILATAWLLVLIAV